MRPSPRPGSRPRSGSRCRPRTRPPPPRRARPGVGPGLTAGRNANQWRRPSSGSAAATAGPVAAGSPAQVEPRPRAIATRSPRMALLVAGPPAPGPTGRRCRAARRRSRRGCVTPSVQPNGLSAGTAVGTTDASIASPRRRRGGEQLDRQPERGRPFELLVGDAGDAGPAVAARRRRPAPDGRGVQPRAERQPGEDHELVDRVVALDVAGRVGLGVAQLLGVLEDLVVRPAILGHRGQDVVRRAVDDAADARDLVGGEVARRAVPRTGMPPATAASNRRAAPVRRAAASRSGPWWAMTCLLAVTTALPAPQRGHDQRPGRLVAAHHLDDDVDLRVGDEVGRRVGQQVGRDAGRAGPVEVADRDAATA